VSASDGVHRTGVHSSRCRAFSESDVRATERGALRFRGPASRRRGAAIVVGAEHRVWLGPGARSASGESTRRRLVGAFPGSTFPRGQRPECGRVPPRRRLRSPRRGARDHAFMSLPSSSDLNARSWHAVVSPSCRSASTSLSFGRASSSGSDHRGGASRRTPRLRRRVGERPRRHPRRAGTTRRPTSTTRCSPLRVGGSRDRARRAGYQRVGAAAAQPARAGELTREPRRAVGRPPHDRRGRGLVGKPSSPRSGSRSPTAADAWTRCSTCCAHVGDPTRSTPRRVRAPSTR